MCCEGCPFAIYELAILSDGSEEWSGYCGSSECLYESSPLDVCSPFDDYI